MCVCICLYVCMYVNQDSASDRYVSALKGEDEGRREREET